MALGPDYRDFVDGIVLNPIVDANTTAQNVDFADVNIPVVYGLQRVKPPRIFVAQNDFNSNQLVVVYALSEGPCLGIYRLFVDGVYVQTDNPMLLQETPSAGFGTANLITTPISGPYYDVAEFEFMSGREFANDLESNIISSSIADPTKRPVYDNELCYMVCRFTWINDASTPYDDIPELTVDLFGKQVADSSPTDTTRKYSTNPAKQMWDYLTSTRYGAGFDASKLDTTSFSAAVTYFDSATTVTLTNGVEESTKRITSNVVVDTEKDVRSNINTMLTTNYALLCYRSDGKFHLDLEKSDTAEVDITEAAIVGQIRVTYPDGDSKYNSVFYTFPDAQRDFQKTRRRYPVTDAEVNALVVEDNGFVNTIELDFASITDPYMAQRLARQYLEKSRKQTKFTFTTFKDIWKYQVGDIIRIKVLAPDIDYVEARIISMTVTSNDTVNIEAYEHNDEWYAPFVDFYQLPEDYRNPLIPIPGGVKIPQQPEDPISVNPPDSDGANPGPDEPGNPGDPDTSPILPIQPGDPLPEKPQAPTFKYNSANVSGHVGIATIGPDSEYYVARLSNTTGSFDYAPDADFTGAGGFGKLTFRSINGVGFYELLPALTHRNGNKDLVGFVYEVDDKGNFGWVDSTKRMYFWDPENPTLTVNSVDASRAWNTAYHVNFNLYNTLIPRLQPVQSINDVAGAHEALNYQSPIVFSVKGNPYGSFSRTYRTFNANYRHFDSNLYGNNSGAVLPIRVKFFNYINKSQFGLSVEFSRYIGEYTYNISNANMTQSLIADSRSAHNTQTNFSDLPF